MKKLFSICIVLTLFFSVLSFKVNAEQNLKVGLNGKNIEFDVKPFINEDNRTLVPVRFIAENLGAKVNWNGEKKEVTISNADKQIKIVIDKKQATVNKKLVELDTKAIIKNSRTFVPLRFISENMDLNVDWNEKTKTVELKTKDYKEPTSTIKNATDFAVRPITDFIDKGIPKKRTYEGEMVNMEKTHISSYGDLPLKIGDLTIYKIEKVKKPDGYYLKLTTDSQYCGIDLCYIKNGYREGTIIGKIGFIDKNGIILSPEKNQDGTYNFYYNAIGFFKRDKNDPNVYNSDYIVLASGSDDLMVLIDNTFKNK